MRLPRLSTITAVLIGVFATDLTWARQGFDQFDAQRFLYQGTFALELSPSSDARHRIVTYLPHNLLVFYHPTLSTKPVGKNQYRAVVTQFGQQLWVLDSEVSNDTTYSQVYGTQSIIFNQDGFMCPLENKICDEVSGQEVNRGSVLEILSSDLDFYHLRLRRGFGEGEDRVERIQDGYVSTRQFEEFERLGVLTDARRQHPAKIHTNTRILDALSTRCGVTWSGRSHSEVAAELNVEAGFDLLGFLSTAFGISATKSQSESIEASYGGPGIATKRMELTMIEPTRREQFADQPDQKLFLSLVIHCIGSQNDQEAVHVSSVTVRDGASYLGELKSTDVFQLPNGAETPSDNALSTVYSRNGRRPFLWSITSRTDYRRAIRTLMREITGIDVAVANVLLSELNASCSNAAEGYRTQRQICNDALPDLR